MEPGKFKERLTQLLGTVSNRVRGVSAEPPDALRDEDDELETLAAQVEQARREWFAARAYFENVSDPELVDHAIHLVLASEKKYAYLLKEAKKTYSQSREA